MAAPLDREHITSSTQIMLPANALMGLILGVAWLVMDASRYSPALAYLDHVWTVPGAGVVLIVGGLSIVAAMLTGRRAVAAITLGGASLLYFALAAVFVAAAHDQGASLTAGMWPAYVGIAHLASIRSLAREEAGDL